MYLSNGNMKLKGDTKNQFIIWSLPACITCPFKTALCEKYCYAKKAERMYKNTRVSRNQNLVDSLQDDFIERIKYLIIEKANPNKKIWFRIHEGGDFYSVEYVNKWIEIAKAFPTITFMAYTKSIDFIGDTLPKNFVTRFSIWSDTKKSMLDKAVKRGILTYEAIPKKELSERKEYHCIGDCQTCKVCYNSNIKAIVTGIH